MFSFPWWLSLSIGFLSLSEEILWVRAAGFAFETLPFAFAFVLACYLIGIALGAAYGKRLCARVSNLYGAAALVLAAASVADASVPVLIGGLLHENFQYKFLLFALQITVTAGLKSILFPIAHHLGSVAQGTRVGRSVSRIYFGNIIGATLGPLVTGFVALDHLSVDECFALSAAACLLLSMLCVLHSRNWRLIAAPAVAAALLSTFSARIVQPGPGALRVVAVGNKYMTHWASNRHGIVHTVKVNVGDYVFGGNVYDGIAAIDVNVNANRLDRLYLLALLHHQPKRVLSIGMSTGAWIRAVQGFAGVETIDVVEINPAYVDLTRQYPDLAPLLGDPRVHIHIDDGRRWLRRNPDLRYDLVIQNTTYHWRANADNLLSQEYLQNVKAHMAPGAVLTTNATGSFDVLATMAAVFPYAYRYANFGYASDHALVPNLSLLLTLRRPDGEPFSLTNVPMTSVVGLLSVAKLQEAGPFIASRNVDARIITDDNLVTEYRHGRRIGPRWLQALQPATAPEFGLDD
ncbi:MAG: fused MFS/spermidine synthase [Proteobacteria bacterium]|nr:fused MFS/spermidine synthase [Pseudomonadota bacterium]